MAARTKRIDQASTVTKSRPKTKTRTKGHLEPEISAATKLPSTPPKRRRSDPVSPKPAEPTPELEFMEAMQDYKKSSGRMFPTWSEVLEVLQGLGYRKPDEETPAPAAVLVSESA